MEQNEFYNFILDILLSIYIYIYILVIGYILFNFEIFLMFIVYLIVSFLFSNIKSCF